MFKSIWRKAANYLLKYALILFLSAGACYLAYSLHTSLIIVGVHFKLASNLLWIVDVLGTVVLGSAMLFCIAAIDSQIQAGPTTSPLQTKALKVIKVEAIAALVVLGLEFSLKALLRAS